MSPRIVQANDKPGPERPPPAARRTRLTRIAVLLVVAVVAAGLSIFVVSLPPALTVSEGSTVGAISGNFSSYAGAPRLAWFNATTYANQSSGPRSTYSLRLTLNVQYNSAEGTIQIALRVALFGRFAANVRPSSLELFCNQTGPDSHVDSQASDQTASNVSFDENAAFGILDNGSGILRFSLAIPGGAGPSYEFGYSDTILMTIRYPYNHLLGFRAVLSGWLLPSIGVGVLLKIIHDPGGIWA